MCEHITGNRIKTKLLGAFLLLLFVSSCQTKPEQTPEIVDECIPPLETFAYSVSISHAVVPGSSEMQIPPNWEFIKDIPDNFFLEFTRENNDHVELWFSEYQYGDPTNPEINFSKQFHIYDVKTTNMDIVSAEIEKSGIFVDDLLLANNSVWGTITFEKVTDLANLSHPILSKFNENTNQFEFVDEVSNIPFSVAENQENSHYWVSIIVDHEGNFWLLVPNDAIYYFDPVDKRINSIFDINDIVPFLPVISHSGELYFIQHPKQKSPGVYPTARDIKVYEFDTNHKTLEQLPIWLTPWPFYPNILVDHNNTLWLGAVGFREEDGTVYQLEQASIFIINSIESGLDFRWNSPQIFLESSDGLLWFKSANGIASLDPEKQHWCWVSTSYSNIVEDLDHNLWMTAYGKLYKKVIKPEF